MANKEYWFFRLKEDFFFEDRNIRRMKQMPGSIGFEYIVILLELYCLSAKNGGVYEADHNQYGEVNYKAIALDIQHEDAKIVRMAVEHLIAVGLIETYGEDDFSRFHFPQVINSFAKSSVYADKKRMKYQNQKEEALPGPKPQTKKSVQEGRGSMKNVYLSEEEYQALCRTYEDAERIINIYSVRKTAGNADDFSEVIKYAKKCGNARLEEDKAQAVLREARRKAPKEPQSTVYQGVFANVNLSEEEWERLQRMYAEPKKLVDVVSQRIHARPEGDSGYHYAFCQKIGKEDGYKTLGEKKREEAEEAEEEQKRQDAKLQKIYQMCLAEAKLGCAPSEEVIKILGAKAYHELKEIADAAYEKEMQAGEKSLEDLQEEMGTEDPKELAYALMQKWQEK